MAPIWCGCFWRHYSPTTSSRSAVLLASTLGALVGAGINYVLNYVYTFGSRRPHSRAMPRFLLVASAGILLNGVIVGALIATTSVHYLVVQGIATGVVLIAGFWANRLWTF